SRFRQRLDEEDFFGAQRLAQSRRDSLSQFFRKFCASGLAASQHAEGHQRIAFQVVGDADGRGFYDAFVPDQDGFDLGGAYALARDLQRVVAAAQNVPMAVGVNRRPIAVNPDVRKSRPVGLQITLVVFPETSRLSDPGFAGYQLSGTAANRKAVPSNPPARDAGTWREKSARFDRQQRIAHKNTAGDFGPA